MARLGLGNIYLKTGLALVIVGLLCAASHWALGNPTSSTAQMLAWVARASLLSGVILYVIGRLAGAWRRVERPGAPPP